MTQKTSTSGASFKSYRQDFESIRSIPDIHFQQLLLEVVDKENRYELSDVEVGERVEGSYNHVVILTLDWTDYAIKVPSQGTPDLWTPADAIDMRSEAYTMMFLRRHTSIPIPQVFGWDASFDNTLGAPYIIQAGSFGVPAYLFFLKHGEDGELDIQQNEAPSPALRKLRNRMLRELAQYMAQLQQFKFDQSGILYFEDNPEWEDAEPPTVGPSFQLLYEVNEEPTFSNTQELLSKKKEEWVLAQKAQIEGDGKLEDEGKRNALLRIQGASEMLKYVIDRFPGAVHPDIEEDEKFVLCHPDLDLQNILINPNTGEILSIIDWQGVRTVPRAMGFASLPLLLRSDWDVDYSLTSELTPWILDEYRDLYTEYMKAALGRNSDAVYTRHSYWAWYTFKSICEHNGYSIWEYIDRIRVEIPLLSRFKGDEFLIRWGSQYWPTAASMLIEELDRLFI